MNTNNEEINAERRRQSLRRNYQRNRLEDERVEDQLTNRHQPQEHIDASASSTAPSSTPARPPLLPLTSVQILNRRELNTARRIDNRTNQQRHELENQNDFTQLANRQVHAPATPAPLPQTLNTQQFTTPAHHQQSQEQRRVNRERSSYRQQLRTRRSNTTPIEAIPFPHMQLSLIFAKHFDL